jgi:ribosomal protein S18 acetylase RimI-like enzyme
MPTLSIRPATVEDALAIATVHVKTWQVAYRGQIPDAFLDSMSIERRNERWRGILAAMQLHEKVLVAELDGKIVGFCVVGRCRDADADETVGELYAIYVDAQTMNQGVGSTLIHAGQEYLREQGYQRATLWVLESNHRSRRFYERKGWAADGATRTEEVANAVIPEMRYAIHFSPI